MQNGVFGIRPYRWQNMWVFDDERVGLVKEPFVMRIPEIINKAVAHLPNPAAGFTVLFNNTGLPSADVVLRKLDIDSGGSWYEQEGTGMKGWLCPALFKYYPQAPERLYIKVSE
ncbi:MAG: hypothetical protein JWR18_1102 [Segetibacter sp.]|nr:hypothetical protein [Segetibacter sp.]